ncbi:Hypothetical predicted protein [Cloeon dipterum]|uniref:Poly [ADP-ribose] polymerase n=1 Tax=Cloeon dipterum TaxID=197152 RepID=A0A8S1C267_9INSE|nr:Hypothetical predicted protein [Cloeon dipterum]
MDTSRVAHYGVKVSYKIQKIYKVKNSTLWMKYTSRRQQIALEYPKGEKVPEMHLFHGTRCTDADTIVEHGFNIEKSDPQGMFGKGIYFANLSSKCNQYTFEGYKAACKDHRNEHCTQCIRKMLLCKVAVGKMYEAQAPMNGNMEAPKGYHSIVANPKPHFLVNPEYVIYNNSQAYPSFLIEYKITV